MSKTSSKVVCEASTSSNVLVQISTGRYEIFDKEKIEAVIAERDALREVLADCYHRLTVNSEIEEQGGEPDPYSYTLGGVEHLIKPLLSTHDKQGDE